MSNLQGQNSFQSEASHVATTVATHARACPSALKARVFGTGRWVALTSDGKLRYSTDGIEWNPAYLPDESFLRGVAFGNGQFVAVGGSYLGGGSVILTSANGRSWNLHHCPSKHVLHGVAYSGDRFIAVGASGTILTSKTGQRWQKQASDTDATLAAIAYGNGTCVIGGDDGLMLSSRDAKTWTRQTSGTSRYVSNMAFVHERFVATTGDRHLASSDGSRWQAIDSAAVPVGGLLARTNVTVSKASPAE
jgi:photosystem II stability/assembly factor-like uncharacterized protein